MYCTNCGHPLKPGASFCTECEEPVPKENYTPKAGKEIKLSVSKKQRTRKRVLLWIVFPAALLILFVLLVNNPVENTKAIVFDSYGDLPIGEAADKYLKNVKWDSEKNSDGSYTVTIRGTYPELNARIGVDFHYTEDEEYCWASADQVYINGTKFTDGATIAMVMALIYGDEDTAAAAMAWSIFA